MRLVTLARPDDFDGWRDAARALAIDRVPPDQVVWQIGTVAGDLVAGEAVAHETPRSAALRVPRAFLDLARSAIRHDDPERFSLLYALLLALQDDPRLIDDHADPLVRRVERMALDVRGATGGNARAAWAALKTAAASCTRCPLCKPATQTVFGEGPVDAALMLVGEQPGDQEDLAGRPFVGPAGKVFDHALAEAGIDRARVYVTNAVKHFKFVPRGRRRIHDKPDVSEIEACRWWIDRERAIVRPRVTVALGAVAARALFGRPMTIGRERGRALDLPDGGGEAWVTVHPSYLLRIPDKTRAGEEQAHFVADLKMAAARAA